MSNALAIAAVTATLKRILEQGISQDPDLPDTEVTIQPLDKARGNKTKNQLNLFLYQIQRNAAWVNTGLPQQQVRLGESGFLAPLPLNLWYLVTAFGRNDDSDNSAQPFGHHLLGKAMSILHDHPELSAADIIAATQTILPASDLDRQIERIRISFQPVPVGEINQLWTGFATPLRLSVAYEVAVTLIESKRPAKTPLPVLTRGPQDQGVTAVASLPPLLVPSAPLAAARLGDDITLNGQRLNNGSFRVRFRNAFLPDHNDIDPEAGGTSTQITVHLKGLAEDAEAFTKWVPGIYTVSLVGNGPNFPGGTSEVALAPVITVSPNNASAGAITLQITCAPRLLDPPPPDKKKQQVFLLFGENGSPIPVQSLVNPADTSQPTRLTFLVPAATAGTYVVRLRVDGVDSLPVVSTKTPPVVSFDPLQEVTVT